MYEGRVWLWLVGWMLHGWLGWVHVVFRGESWEGGEEDELKVSEGGGDIGGGSRRRLNGEGYSSRRGNFSFQGY